MNSKIALSAVSIFSALALMGGSAFAAFTDTASALGNTFSSSSADLQIAAGIDTGTGYTATIPNLLNGANISPGFTHDYPFVLHNGSTGTGTVIDVVGKFVNPTGNSALRDALLVKFNCGGPDIGPYSVSNWISGQAAIVTVAAGASVQCTATASLPSSADNSVSGLSAGFDVNFNGTERQGP